MANNYSGTSPDDKRKVRIPLVGAPNNRTQFSTKDQKYVNVLIEPVVNEITKTQTIYCIKRPALQQYIQPPGTSADGRGIYSWQNNLYSVFGNKVYKNSSLLTATLTTSSGLVDFSETSAIAATPYLALNDGTDLWLIKSDDTVTKVTDVDYPTTNNLGNVIFFDGYTIVAQTNGRIWNSANEDPSSWGALDYISAQMYPDNLVSVARQNNTLVAFGEWSTQFFYDAAGASPGSFMLSLDQGALQLGCANKDTVVQQENFLIWVSRAQTGGYTVQKLDGITNLKTVSTSAIEKQLSASSVGLARGMAVRTSGHFVYLLTLNYPLTGNFRTFCYDIGNDFWTEWQTGNTEEFKCVASIQHIGLAMVQHKSDGGIYYFEPLNNLDNFFFSGSQPIYLTIQTTNYDYETMYRKFCSRIELVGDKQGVSLGNALVTIQYTDDDYQSYSTARTIDMATRMWLTRLGTFRRRAWVISHSANSAFRLEAIEVDIQEGEQ